MHVGIIMDGSGRWAQRRDRPRIEGHVAGVAAVRNVVARARDLDVDVLTLFTFSSDNWQRPAHEIAAVMSVVRQFLCDAESDFVRSEIRVDVIGRRDRLPLDLLHAIESAEKTTRDGQRLHLRLAVDYSSRESILRAAQRIKVDGTLRRDEFSRVLNEVNHADVWVPDVDLLVRTGGEQRLSDFLLWECAYAELYFTPTLWPEFGADDFQAAIDEFHARERRFGGLPKSMQA